MADWLKTTMSTTSPSVIPSYVGRNCWGPRLRAVASVLILLHVIAVVSGPLAVQPSMFTGRLWSLAQPYIEAAFLNHGYHFFAPEPGPSHLVRYELVLEDGTRRAGVFPSREDHWPRLLYHRHFMLSERLGSAPPETPWIGVWCRSYGEHLLERFNAREATLYLRRHLIPYPDQVIEGMKLDDPRLYEERRLGTYARPTT